MALRTLLIYDVPDDRLRNKIADLCLDYGLDRIQYSAFVGELRRTHQEELMMKIKKQVGKRPANVQLVPICEKDWASRLEMVVENGRGSEEAHQRSGERAKQPGG